MSDEQIFTEIRSAGPWLLTGGSGEIGSYCVRYLNSAGVEPFVVLRRPMPPGAWRDARVVEVPGDLEQLCAGDRLSTWEATLSRARTIIHLAARVNLAGRGPDQMGRLNERATIRLFECARQAGVARFVHVSTTGTVGCSNAACPLDEDAAYNLAPFHNPYFDTKRAAEETMLAEWRHDPSRTDLVVVNPSINIGPQGSFRRLSRTKKRRRPPRPGSLAYKLLCFWIAGGLNLVDVRDVARGIILAALRGRAGERYILAGANLSFRELMEHLQREFGARGPKVRLPLATVRVAGAACDVVARATGRRLSFNRTLARLAGYHWYYDSSKAIRELGFAPRPFESTLADLRTWVEDLRRR